MKSFITRTTSLLVAAAFALFANAQTATTTTTQAQATPQAAPAAQTQAPAVRAPATAVQTPAAATPRQTVRSARVQSNPNVVARPNVTTTTVPQAQPAPAAVQPQVRTSVAQPTTAPNTQLNFQPRPILQNQRLEQRTALLPGSLRAPDIGLWFTRPTANGLVVADVATTGPIARLGFREGDRIVSVNGVAVASEPEFMQTLVADPNPSQVVVFRDGRNQAITVDPSIVSQATVAAPVSPIEQFGLVLDDRFGNRITVWRVIPESPAFYAGFRAGDVITTFAGQPFRTRTEFERALTTTSAGEVPFQTRRGDRVRDLVGDIPRFFPNPYRTNVQVDQPVQTTAPTLDRTRSEPEN